MPLPFFFTLVTPERISAAGPPCVLVKPRRAVRKLARSRRCAEFADTLVRIAMGDSPVEAISEPGEAAFDLALDVLSPLVSGDGRITHESGKAAKRGEPSRRFPHMSEFAI